MKTLTLVKFTNDQEQLWHRISKDDIVESFENNSLKAVSKDIAEKYNIKKDDRKDKFEDDEELNEEFEDALNDCDYAETFMEDMIRVDSIDEETIYFDSYNDEFFSGTDILSWGTEKYYWYHDGSNWQMKEICEIKEVEAEEIGSENNNTGCLETFELKNGKIFIIESSMYQGSIDNVIDDYNNIIEEC